MGVQMKEAESIQNRIKRDYLNEWVKAVNSDGRFGRWSWAVSFGTSDIKDIINKHSTLD